MGGHLTEPRQGGAGSGGGPAGWDSPHVLSAVLVSVSFQNPQPQPRDPELLLRPPPAAPGPLWGRPRA